MALIKSAQRTGDPQYFPLALDGINLSMRNALEGVDAEQLGPCLVNGDISVLRKQC
jgi:hypothetical protein